MVSRETNLLSHEFVAGVLSVLATFYQISTPRNQQFGFQIKMAGNNYRLLSLIAAHLKLNEPKKYGASAVLNTRDSRILINDVIPFCDKYLAGQKLIQYLQWKRRLLQKYATLEKNA